MKLAQILAIAAAGGFLATDKKPADLEAAILAADASMPGNVASSKEIYDKRAKDRAARDARRAKDRAAKDAKRAEDRKAEDKARDEKRAARDAKLSVDRDANDKSWAKDRDLDPECTNDKVMEANDAAMKSEGEAEDAMEAEDAVFGTQGATEKPTIDTAAEVAKALAARDDLHSARAEVEPILGKVTMDSAAEIRRAALKKLGVDAATVHESALAGMLQMAKDKAAAPAAPLATDGVSSVSAMAKLIPGYDRLK